jgi:hypothetical protein
MNTRKRFALGALAAGLLLSLAIAAPAWADTSNPANPSAQDSPYEHLWQMRSIMHDAAFTAAPANSGVTVSVISLDPALAAAIQHEFIEEHPTLVSPLAGSTVSASKAEGGVKLAFTSSDAATVQALQSYGATLGYALLRNNMQSEMLSLQGSQGFGPGWGMMGGYGPGWMHGWRGGYGPGNGPGNGPGPGYGPGSGYGPGWMHGWRGGYGPGNGPQGQAAPGTQQGSP